jgi:hypothetical protein
MKREIFLKLLAAVHQYYPLGAPRLANAYDRIAAIISDKLVKDGRIERDWQSVMEDLKIVNEKFSNYSFIQFPSLTAVIDKTTSHNNIQTSSSFVVCVSLLCPFYTYYFQYGHSVKSIVNFNKITFFKNQTFDTLKFPIDAKRIDDIIKKHFPAYEFIDHYALMVNNLIGGSPYGQGDSYADGKTPYSLFQFLFNSQQDKDIHE